MSTYVIPEVKMKFTKKDLATLIEMMGINQNLAVNILNSIPTGISITTDISCKEIRNNRTAAKFLRNEPWESFPYSDNIQLPVRIFHNGNELTDIEMPIQRSAWNGEEVQGLEIEFIWNDGVHKTSVWNANPLCDDRGTIIGAVATFEDITEQRKMENELSDYRYHLEMLVEKRTSELESVNDQLRQEIQQHQKTQEELRKANQKITGILDSISDAFYTLDKQWCFTYLNREAERLLKENAGVNREDLLGKSIWGVLPRLIDKKLYHEYHRAVTEQVSVHIEHFTVYGEGKWLEFNIYPSKGGLSVYYKDITRRKKAEKALRQSEERFFKAYNANPLSMVIISIDNGAFLDVNESFLRNNGYSKEDIIGFKATDMGYWVDLEELSNFLKEIRLNGYSDNSEVRFRKKSGNIMIGLFSGVIINLYGEECILGIANDITELRRYQNEMARLDRLNLIGEMAAGIGHEVRNPMTTIKGFLQLLREKKECSNYGEYFDLMVSELDRANDIITEFLSLAKNKSVDLKKRDLNKILKSILPLIEADGLVTDKYINLETQKIPDLLLDEKEIRQLVLNLVRNGLEVTSSGGIISIRTYSEEGEVVLSVQDNGKGINPDVLEKLGTPFFTTKDNGTGLGLAVCNSIAARHNARIDIETGPEGTTFFVRFKKPA